MDLRELPETVKRFRRHPWETVRTRFFQRLLRSRLSSSEVRSVLDVGAGDGWTTSCILEDLPEATGVCWDINYSPETMARLESEFEGLTFTSASPEGRYDLLLFLDLLEHIDDERRFLSDLVREKTTENARVLVSVPAWQALYTSHDATFSHRRRYSPSELRRVLEDSGLEVVVAGSLFHALLLPRIAQTAAELVMKRTRTPGTPRPLAWGLGDITAQVLETVLDAEGRVSLAAANAGLNIPGLSTWALCRRK